MKSRKLIAILFAMVFIMGAVSNVHAFGSYLTTFNSTYGTSGTALDTCGICHVDPAGGGTRNRYGLAFAAVSTHSSNPAGAFATIASQASACGGYTYLQLINLRINPGNGFCPAPVACTGYTYSVWSVCGANGQQTRTVTAYTPSGCSGTPSTPAVLTQTCTPTPVACSGYTYSTWSVCGSNGQQTRTVTAYTPSGCSGTPPTSPLLTQTCTPAPTTCTYTYTAWSACKPNNRQTRKVISSTPAGCTGTPVLRAECNYISPKPENTSAPALAPTPKPAIDGTTLYMQRCSACHGSIEKSQVRGATASDIKKAITGASKMSFLKTLTRAQIQAIADALVTTTPPPTPPVPAGGVHPDGWLDLHPDFVDRNGTSSCKTCHGQDLQGGIGPSCYSCHGNND